MLERLASSLTALVVLALCGAARAAPSSTNSDGATVFLGTITLSQSRTLSHPDALTQAALQTKQYFLQSARGLAQPLEITATASQHDAPDIISYFVQTYNGVPVEGTYALAVSRGNVLRYARQRFLSVATPVDTTEQITVRQAEAQAIHVMQQNAASATLSENDTSTRAVLVQDSGVNLAWKVYIATRFPWEMRAVYIDAHDGHYLTSKKLSHEKVAGTVNFAVEPGCVGDVPVPTPMPEVRWVSGSYTDANGEFSKRGSVRQAQITLESRYFVETDESKKLAGPWTYALAALPADNELSVAGAPLDQIDPFYHAQRVRAWMRAHIAKANMQTAWGNTKVKLHVNLPDTCNAYYDGTLNFFSEGDGCLNTGRTGAIVYHEYGHGIHDHSTPSRTGMEMDGQVSEGIADYVAATLTDNPNMRGIFSCQDNFRSCANTLSYCDDGCDFDPWAEAHDAGQVICAVWWEIRTQMMTRYGTNMGKNVSDTLFLKFLTHVGDMDSAYAAAIASDEDKDGNPRNGTKHSCEINQAFSSSMPGAKPHFPNLRGMVPCVP